MFKPIVKSGIDAVLARLEEFPEPLRTEFRRHGGGYVNHDLYFKTLRAPTTDKTNQPSAESALGRAIASQYGSFKAFQDNFNGMCNKAFGSAWCFLSVDPAALAATAASNTSQPPHLLISVTQNQDTPLMQGQKPILTCDLWEHAFMLDFPGI